MLLTTSPHPQDSSTEQGPMQHSKCSVIPTENLCKLFLVIGYRKIAPQNIMYDRRVVRGNTFAALVIPVSMQTDPVSLEN